MKSNFGAFFAVWATISAGCSGSDVSIGPNGPNGPGDQGRGEAGTDAQGGSDVGLGMDVEMAADVGNTSDAPGRGDAGGGADARNVGDARTLSDAPTDGRGTMDARGGADAASPTDATTGGDAAQMGQDASGRGDVQVDSSSGSLGVGAHAYINDTQGLGVSPMTTPPVTTRSSGSTFVLFLGFLGAAGTVSDNMGNTYTQVGTWISYAMGQGWFSAYVCVGCVGGSGHTFSFNKPTATMGAASAEASLFALEILGGPSVDTFAQADSLTNPIDAGNVTTTHAGDALVIGALGNSYNGPDNYTASAGYTLLDQQTNGGTSMAGADAVRIVGAPGVYGGTLTSSMTINPGGGSAVFLIALGK